MSETRNSPESSSTDLDVLNLARIVLRSADYRTSIAGIDAQQILIAEGGTAVVVVAAAATVERLLNLEPQATSHLIERLGERSVPDRRRDGYLFLLSAQPAEASQAEALFNVTYNLRHVRRIVRVGIEPTAAGIARAMRPVLPLITRMSTVAMVDPLSELESRLVEDGLDERIVREAVTKFRSTSLLQAGTRNSDDRDLDEI
jgi:hypothetical protein